ncbi:MAG: ABC transporter ATP-binding protein [Patescibacteria group bacterium]
MLIINNIAKTFFSNTNKILPVLNDINFVVDQSEFLSIVGPSGCGKSTLLKIISGLEEKDAGQIIFQPKVYNKKLKAIMIWQDNRLFPWLTVRQNISFGLEASENKIEAEIERYIDLFKLNNFENYYHWQLSEGMQERVAIARALIVKPDILLMDESFASIDYQTKLILFAEVKNLQKILKIPIIYVTHDIRDAISFSDKVIILSARPAKIKKIIDTKNINLDIPLEKEILNLMKE